MIVVLSYHCVGLSKYQAALVFQIADNKCSIPMSKEALPLLPEL